MYSTDMNLSNGLIGIFPSPTLQSNSSSFLLWYPNSSANPLQLPTFSTAAKVRVIMTFVLFTVSTFCNLAVLWTASTSSKRKSHVRILIINLTIADLLVTFIVMPVDAIWNITLQWWAGDVACRVLMFLKLLAMYSGAFVTVVISLDRQSAILNPLAINEAKKKNKIMLSVAWALSIFFSVPQWVLASFGLAAMDTQSGSTIPVLSNRGKVNHFQIIQEWIENKKQNLLHLMFLFHNVTITFPQNFTQCTTQGSFDEHWQETLYNMFTFVCLFLLPLIIMISCYTRILIEITKRMSKGNLSSKEVHLRRSNNNIPKARLRTLKMSIVIVTSFIICWTPYYLLGLWYWFSPEGLEETVSNSLTHILFIFGLLNTCLDPIIYGLFSIHFRKGLKRYCHNVNRRAESENNSIVTGSFHCSASSFHMKRLAICPREVQGSPTAKSEVVRNGNGYLLQGVRKSI